MGCNRLSRDLLRLLCLASVSLMATGCGCERVRVVGWPPRADGGSSKADWDHKGFYRGMPVHEALAVIPGRHEIDLIPFWGGQHPWLTGSSDPPTRKQMEETALMSIAVESAGLMMDFNYYGRLIYVGLSGEAPATDKPTDARPGAGVEARSEAPEHLIGLTAGEAIERMGSDMNVGIVGMEWPVGHPDPDEMRREPAAELFFPKKGGSLSINYYGEVIAVNGM